MCGYEPKEKEISWLNIEVMLNEKEEEIRPIENDR
jgi:hypothetical protein